MKLLNPALASSASAFALLAAATGYAASSGNFTAGVNNANCTINSATGGFSTGNTSNSAGTAWPISTQNLQIQVSSGNGVALEITPSAVSGLYTDNKLQSSGSSTEDVGVQVQVNVAPAPGTSLSGPIQISPNVSGDPNNPTDTGATCVAPAGSPAGTVSSCVIYDQRFVQISSSALQQLAAAANITGTLFEMIESTLSAHSFNFYVQTPNGGDYNITAQAQLFVGNNNSSPGSVAGCFGPGTLTVQQVNNFSFDTPLGF